jgi:hypothetical protein
LLGDAPFGRFLALSDWLFATTGQTHRIALDRLYTLVFDGMTALFAVDEAMLRDVLSRDYVESGARGSPKFATSPLQFASPRASAAHSTTQRQARHRREAAQ